MTSPMRNVFDLSGKVVLATGGMSGIGLAFLQGCARQGAKVVVLDRHGEPAKDVVAALTECGAADVHIEIVDVAEEAAVVRAFASVLAAMGRIDCVFANAGINRRVPSFDQMPSETWHGLLDINLHGAFYTLREAARHMKERAQSGDPGGSIVVCGSLAVFHGIQGMQHYAAAKGALAAVAKGMAVELGQYDVRVNMLVPGFIVTGMTGDPERVKEVIERFASITPLGRPGTLTDIEGPAAYLASDASRFHTGDILVIDGGRSVKSL